MTNEEKNILIHTLKEITIEQARHYKELSSLLDRLFQALCCEESKSAETNS